MRHMLVVAALLVMTAPTIGRAADADAENEVAKLSQHITNAVLKGDTSFLDSVTADDWMLIGASGGIQDKASVLRQLKDGTLKVDVMEDSEVKVRVYGDAAVVTGRHYVKRRSQGRETGGMGLFTRVFVRRGGKWQYVSSQSTPIADQPGSSGNKR